MNPRFLYFLIALTLFSCKNEVKKEPEAPSEETHHQMPPAAFSTFENPAGENSHLPRLFSNGESVYLSWVTSNDSLDVLHNAVYTNGEWFNETEVISGNNWFTNWADFPAIAESNGNILTSFLEKSADDTYTYDVKLNLYNAKTHTWKKNFILHTDGTKSEHGFVSIRPYVGDSFFVTWLDGRETVGKGHGGGQMTLRGAIVFEDGSIDYDTLLDERICDCCQTAAAIGPDDELLVAYRDRSEEEIRDISVVRWQKEGGWSQPITIGNDNWKIAGCPVNGPSMDAYGSTVAVAWFTGATGEGDVKVAFSKDTGASFGSSFRVDDTNATGRVDLVMLDDKEAALVWMEPEGEDELIQLMKINEQGDTGHPITISKTSAERASGFPQLERVGDSLYLAWTFLAEDESKTIRTAKISVEEL